MIPLISAAWSHNVEVLTINEKESTSFLDKLLELKNPDLIFSSADDGRFSNSISLNQNAIDFNLESKVSKTENEIALSICTSGSTGEPKVVQLTLENIISFFKAWDEKLPWRETEYFASIAHPAFDIGVAELIFPLWKDWNIKLFNKSILSDPTLLQRELLDVTAFHMVPTLLDSWIDGAESDEKERLIMTGGDKVPPYLHEKLKQKFPNAQLFQFYGPSECSVLASGFANKGQFENNLLPLGTPFKH
ncbi:MAG: AMP-binding protein, partial [Crocinitomicaceae bacterium]